MNETAATLLFVAAITTPCGISLWWLGRNSARVYKRLREIEVQALNAGNESELEDAQVALQLYASQNCWHRYHTDRAREVMAYIRGRMKAL